MKLYELGNNYQRVVDLAATTEAETLKDTLDAIKESIDIKAENIAKVIKTLEAEEAGLDTEIKRMTARKTTITNGIKGLKYYLQTELEKIGTDKIEGQHFTIAIQKNNPSARIEDESKLIAYLVEQPKKLDKKALLVDLKAGIEVEGAELYQGRSLRIR
ncbi:siphovirus Gp157 family protein [Paenilisteria newyorkensis]|uniref:siphovirus Gp157 family protein n=1 Tax=Listeria newyorkensis TaxID=1497681 RepID=UPI002359BC39|nr:siphovirus Gp157 family protein [Listeria newyorkensis]WAO22054.1 siphovirus Gp157 family protein [Listeria newyorkensis]